MEEERMGGQRREHDLRSYRSLSQGLSARFHGMEEEWGAGRGEGEWGAGEV